MFRFDIDELTSQCYFIHCKGNSLFTTKWSIAKIILFYTIAQVLAIRMLDKCHELSYCANKSFSRIDVDILKNWPICLIVAQQFLLEIHFFVLEIVFQFLLEIHFIKHS